MVRLSCIALCSSLAVSAIGCAGPVEQDDPVASEEQALNSSYDFALGINGIKPAGLSARAYA